MSQCENCRLQAYAERKPRSIIARIWRWHTRWCPAWKAYQQSLEQKVSDEQSPTHEAASTDPSSADVKRP